MRLCAGAHPRLFVDDIYEGGLAPQPDGRQCTCINADNCEECFRAIGQDCTGPMGSTTTSSYMAASTGTDTPTPRYSQGVEGGRPALPWVEYQEYPPPPARHAARAGGQPGRGYWDDISEHDPDYLRGVIDFESYRVWRVAGWTRPPGTDNDCRPRSEQWGMIAEYDVANFIPPERQLFGPANLALGRNTGLEAAVYEPVVPVRPAFAGLAEEMADFVEADTEGTFTTRSGAARPPGQPSFPAWKAWFPGNRGPRCWIPSSP